MTNTTETDTLRSEMRIAAARHFNLALNDECFAAVDTIIDAIIDDGETDADVIADLVPSVYDREVANQWFALNAQGAGEDYGYTPDVSGPIGMMRVDVYAVAYEAAAAAVEVFNAGQEGN